MSYVYSPPPPQAVPFYRLAIAIYTISISKCILYNNNNNIDGKGI